MATGREIATSCSRLVLFFLLQTGKIRSIHRFCEAGLNIHLEVADCLNVGLHYAPLKGHFIFPASGERNLIRWRNLQRLVFLFVSFLATGREIAVVVRVGCILPPQTGNIEVE